MKKRFLFALTASTITAAAAVALMPKMGIMSYAEGCEHVGNHYDAVAATCASAGNKEFWACCVCHEQFVTAPGKGTWDDKGAYAGPALASSHAAYLAPLEHTPGDWAAYDRGDSIGLNAACSECGEGAYAEDIETATKPVVSTAEWTVLTTTPSGSLYDWSYDAESGTYTANNKKVGSSVAVLQLNVTKAGTLVFDYSIICEIGYDYLTVFKNSNITGWSSSNAISTGNGAVWNTRNGGANTGYAGTYSLDVAAGDKITFTKRNDGSGWGKKDGSDYDECTLTLAGAFTYGVAKYEVNGGSAVNPSLTINGKLVHDAPVPTKDGFTFDGWYKSSTFEGEPISKGSYIGDNVTLYAKWWDNNDSHAFKGAWKGFGFKANTGSTSVNSLLSNYSINVTMKGGLEWTSPNSTDVYNGTFSDPDADGLGTIGDRQYMYFAEDGVMIIKKTVANGSNYFWIFVKDSEQAYTSGTVLGCAWGTYALGYRTVFEFPLASGAKKLVYVDSFNNDIEYGVSVVSLKDGVALKDVATSTNVGFSIYKGDGTLYKNFGYNGSTMVAPTDSFFGKYTNSVAGDEYTEIVVSGAGKFSWYKGSSWNNSNEYKVREGTNVLYYASGNQAAEYTIDKENGTFARSIPTITITYNLNGHTGELQVGSSFTLDGNTQKVAKAYDANTGAWLYTSDLATIKDSKATDGSYSFEGWYTDAACTTAVKQCHPTEDMTLYAKWAQTFSVTCVLGGGAEDSVVYVKEGQTPSLTNPKRDGYLFAGWYTDAECTQPYTPGAISGDITVYAKWVEKAAWIGTYHAYNCYGNNKNWAQSDAVGHTIYFNDDGTITKGTNKSDFGKFDSSSTLDENGQFVNAKAAFIFQKAADNRYFMAAPYSASTSDAMPGDLLLGAQLADGESIRFVQTTLLQNNAYLVNVIVTLADSSEVEYICYLDCDNNKLYVGCTLEVNRSGVISSAFADVYASTVYCTSVIIKHNDAVVGVWGKNGNYMKRGDTYAGTYSGSFNGVATDLVLDGFGNCTLGELTGTYTVSGSTATLVLTTGTYKVTLSGSSYSQILDGYEGTYSGANGTLVVTGWGECTVNGEAGTYVISGGKLKITVGGNTAFYDLNKEAGTYTIATASPFSGLTFSYDEEDEYGYNDYYKLIFDEGAAIQGTVWFTSGTFTATFEGEYENGVLTLTFHAGSYTSAVEGKTATFAVSDGKLKLTSQTLAGTYSFPTGVELLCAGFVAPVETPTAASYELSDFAGEYEGDNIAFDIEVSSSGIVLSYVYDDLMDDLCGNCGYVLDTDFYNYNTALTGENEWTVTFECNHANYSMVIKYDGTNVTLVSFKTNSTEVYSNVVLTESIT